MLNEIKDIRLYKIFLTEADNKIEIIEKNEDALFSLKKELKALNRKHAGLFLALQIICFSTISFIILRMLYSVLTTAFPYYLLCPVPGIIIELYFRNKFIKNEKKYTLKTLNEQINSCNENINNAREELNSLVPLIKENKKNLTNITDIMTDNSYTLNYITRNEDDYSKISFEVRYEDFINKINSINEDKYPELIELKNKILKENDKTIYRNIVFKEFFKDKECLNEKDNNTMSDTEKG